MPRAVLPLMILAVTFVACAGDESPTSALTPTPSPTPFPRGEVFDRTGDAEPFPGVAIPSDLVSGTIEVTIGGHVVFTVQFVPGTFDADTTSVQFQLDTDQRASTGSAFLDLGVEYIVDLGSRFNGSDAHVGRWVGGHSYQDVGTASVVFGANGMEVEIPLSMLGDDDGRMNFRITSQTQLGARTFSTISDWMPDTHWLPGTVR